MQWLRITVQAAWLLATTVAVGGATPLDTAKIDSAVLQATVDGASEFFVVFEEQADLRGTTHLPTKQQKGQAVFARLQDVAARTQTGVVALLDAAGAEYRPFWIVNAIWVRGDRQLLGQIAARAEVARIEADTRFDIDGAFRDTDAQQPPRSPALVEWNVARTGAPLVWEEGVRGEGAVVGSMDTGFDWRHPALRQQYRGWNKGLGDHDYNWHDAIHVDFGPCGPDSPEPCDEAGHGTLTMGSAIGDDGAANQIGVAPGAQWIGCRCWEPIRRTHLMYVTECFEWFVAPTDLDDLNPDPARAPHVIFNSWICEFDEGCSDSDVLKTTVQNVRAAGIVVVASAGNSGPGCGTVFDPPAIYEAAFTVGATNDQDDIAGFSSRGPVMRDGTQRPKPEIVAPGQAVRSSIPGGGYETNVSGTSLSGPLVAGAVALMISGAPWLAGDVDAIEGLLIDSAEPLTTSGSCGGVSNDAVPNNTFGWGRLNAGRAYQMARETSVGDEWDPHTGGDSAPRFRLSPNRPNPFNPGTVIQYEIPIAAEVSLVIYDVAGRVVRVLARPVLRGAGTYEVSWDGRRDDGAPSPSGIYFARLESERRLLASRRLALVR